LGHALTARRYGASVAITLNLLVGWASYSAPRPLSRRQQVTVSLAGPLCQIVAAVPVLALTYVALPARHSAQNLLLLQGTSTTVGFDLWQGAVWAGIVIGLLNLVPLWPLDGGHVLDTGLGMVLGAQRGRRAMLVGTLAAVGVITVAGYSTSGLKHPSSWLDRQVISARNAPWAALTRSFPAAVWDQVRSFPGHILDFPLLLLVFCGLNSLLALQRSGRSDPRAGIGTAAAAVGAPDTHGATVPATAQAAERAGWLGDPAQFPPGWAPSPWLQAAVAQRRGELARASAHLGAVVAPGGPRWWLPDPTTRPELASLVPLLGGQFGVGDPQRSQTLLAVLAAHGEAEAIARYGVALYSQYPDPEVLYLVAAGLARTGHHDDAMAWLRRAVDERPDMVRLATDTSLWPLHGRSDFDQLLARARVSRSEDR
jgi:Zn-dependent protease